jgi:hypothetical protein
MHAETAVLLFLCALVGSNANFICRSRSCGLLNTTFLDEASITKVSGIITLTAQPDRVVVSCSAIQCSAEQCSGIASQSNSISVVVVWSWVSNMQLLYEY